MAGSVRLLPEFQNWFPAHLPNLVTAEKKSESLAERCLSSFRQWKSQRS
jgi:hypothetical protein